MALPEGMTSCAMCVEWTTSGSAWVDGSDSISVVEPPTQERMTSEAWVFGETTPVIGVGKKSPIEVECRGVYAEGTTTADVFYQVYAANSTGCGTLFAIRYAPAGCTTAHEVFATATTDSRISSLTYPGGDAGSADVIMYGFTVRSTSLTRATWS